MVAKRVQSWPMKVEGHGVAVTYEVTTLLDAEESGSGTRSAWL